MSDPERETHIGPRASRRLVMQSGLAMAGGLLFAGAAGRAMAASAAPIVRLKPSVAERSIPSRMLGMNTPGVFDVPYEDPKYLAALKAVAPNIIRFPGGTVGNYYNWRIGYMEVPDGPGASVYRKYLIKNALPASRKLHPKGIFIEDWVKIARDMDAALVFNPNLESSSLDEQGAWFADMHGKGIVPNLIEMGTEFFLAMFMDPLTLNIFPDWAATMKRTKQYYDVMKPYLPKDAKVAVQSASSSFHESNPAASANALTRHEAQWDADMKPEPWFDAVTTHLYPGLEGSAGAGALKGLPGNADQVYAAMIARADEGFDRTLDETAARMPGKEIWMTEWGAFEAAQTLGGASAYFSGMWLHQVTRGQLSILRHPRVVLSNFHSAFASGNIMSTFTRANGDYVPINAASVIHWFFTASRGPDAHYQRLEVEGAERISANGTVPGERFWDVEAGIFRRGKEHVLLVHNAWKTPRQIDLSLVIAPDTPIAAETIATPDLLVDLEKGTPVPQPLPTTPVLEVPPYSLTRVSWSA